MQFTKENESVGKRCNRKVGRTKNDRLVAVFRYVLGDWGSTVRFLLIIAGSAAVIGVSIWLLGLKVTVGPVRIDGL